MANEFKLELEKRDGLGSKAVKVLRTEGKIPGVFYSANTAATPFIIDSRHLHDALQSQSHVYAVNVGGKKLHAILKEIQIPSCLRRDYSSRFVWYKPCG